MIKMSQTYHKIVFSLISLFEVMNVIGENSGSGIVSKLGLHAQLLPREPRISLCGSEVIIENHGGLMCYTRARIEVRTRNGYVRINGDGLELAAMTVTDIIIRGLIVSVELC